MLFGRCRIGAAIAVALALSSAAGALAQGAKSRALPPPYAGVYQPQGVDERGLWMISDEEERKVRDSKALIDDPALNDYVRGLLCRAVGQDRCNSVRIYILRVPAFNANMMPNGKMELWSGLLLRMRSEAELAAVLAHEFAHFEQRHSLNGFRRQRSATDIAAWASFLGTLGLTIRDVAIRSSFAFSRAQEREADIMSFRYLAASPYRPGAAADVWNRLMDEADATAAGRGQCSKRHDRVPFFATHPGDLERATYLRKLAETNGTRARMAWKPMRRSWPDGAPLFLADQIKLNDFAGTEYLLSALASSGWTPDLLFARAELYRQRGHPRDLVAAGFYREAIDKGATEPVVRRGLGLALLRNRAFEEGRRALQDYLAMRPDAPDAAMIAALIEQSKANGTDMP